jgi:2-succinyl-5-enolpyruvyl-6-hydroxy-3-cyclohexene-1-carboxylate synthase
MFGAEYVQTPSRETFRSAFSQAVVSDTSHIIEVPTDSVLHEQTRRKIIADVIQQLKIQNS